MTLRGALQLELYACLDMSPPLSPLYTTPWWWHYWKYMSSSTVVLCIMESAALLTSAYMYLMVEMLCIMFCYSLTRSDRLLSMTQEPSMCPYVSFFSMHWKIYLLQKTIPPPQQRRLCR